MFNIQKNNADTNSKHPHIMEQKSIKGTRTEKNLLAAFAGESQARSRYTLFSQKALEEGYQPPNRNSSTPAGSSATSKEASSPSPQAIPPGW